MAYDHFRADFQDNAAPVRAPTRIRKSYTVYDENDIAYKVCIFKQS